jgi:hypothetical protein
MKTQNTLKKNTKNLLDASKKFMSHHQNAGQNYYIKLANIFFKICGKVKTFGNDGKKSKLHSQRARYISGMLVIMYVPVVQNVIFPAI